MLDYAIEAGDALRDAKFMEASGRICVEKYDPSKKPIITLESEEDPWTNANPGLY
jgi:hypothetical protein